MSIEDTIKDLERRMEDLCIDIIKQKNKDGLAINVSVMKLIDEFNVVMDDLHLNYMGKPRLRIYKHD